MTSSFTRQPSDSTGFGFYCLIQCLGDEHNFFKNCTNFCTKILNGLTTYYFLVRFKYSALYHIHKNPDVPLRQHTQLHTHTQQLNCNFPSHCKHTNIMHMNKCAMFILLLKTAETSLQTCNSETHSQCQYDFSCHLTKNSLCGFGLRGGRLLVDGSSDGLSSSSLFSNFFESAQRQVRILATFPGSGFAYEKKSN